MSWVQNQSRVLITVAEIHQVLRWSALVQTQYNNLKLKSASFPGKKKKTTFLSNQIRELPDNCRFLLQRKSIITRKFLKSHLVTDNCTYLQWSNFGELRFLLPFLNNNNNSSNRQQYQFTIGQFWFIKLILMMNFNPSSVIFSTSGQKGE